MNTYVIFDGDEGITPGNLPIIKAQKPIGAARSYLRNRDKAGRDVLIGVLSCTIKNGRVILDGSKRKEWFKITPKP